MSETYQIACAACGYGAEIPVDSIEDPRALQCPMCGTWIRDYAGEVAAASQPAPAPAPAPSTDTGMSPIAACLVEAGSGTLEAQYPLTGISTVVGRDASDINIPDPTMSVHHFEIEARNGEYFIRDLGSTNQTRVNGRPVDSSTLVSGDRIQAGLTVLVFLAG